MAVNTPVLLTSGGSASSASSITTASVSPTANALLVMCIATVNNPQRTHDTCADTFTGTGAWTRQNTIATSQNRVSIWTAQAGSSPGSGTVTVTFSAAAARQSWQLLEVTGHDTTTPVAESASNTGTASTLAVTLANVAAGALAIGFVCSRADSDGITPGTNETEIAEATSGGSAQARCQTEHGTDTNVDWSALATSQNAAVAIEISPGVGGATRKPRARTQFIY